MAYIATVAVLTVLFPKAGGAEYMLYSIFGGGLFLGAFFMATDYATSPVTKKGQLIYGIGCGLFTVLDVYKRQGPAGAQAFTGAFPARMAAAQPAQPG